MPSVAGVSLNEDTKNHSVYSRARLWAAKGGNMSGRDSEARVTLADIEKEIKSMRKEAGMQYKHTLYFNAYAIACAVALLGVSIYTMTLVNPCWQVIDGIVVACIGMGFAAYLWLKQRRLREKQTETEERT